MEEEVIHSLVGYKSSVWKHFGFYKRDGEVDQSNAICKVCRVAIKYTGSTTNLSAHLKCKHDAMNVSQSPSTPASGGDPNTTFFPVTAA